MTKRQENTEWMIWADGTMALLEEIEAGDYHFMSDDYRLATDAEVEAEIGDVLDIDYGLQVPYFKGVN